MKKIFNSILAIAVTLGLASCNFDQKTYQAIPTEDAYASVADVQNALNGTYNAFGSYRFYGNYVVAIGDMAADISTASSSSGHFVSVNNYQITDTESTLKLAWEYGFKVVDRSVRLINGANKLIASNNKLTESEVANLNLYIAQAYALRAVTNFCLVNIFGLPYQVGGANAQLGLPLLEKEPLEPFVKINRATVAQTYEQITADITTAKSYMEKASTVKGSINQFYLNEAAIYALDARVNLFMGKYEAAKTAAQKAIELRASGDVSNDIYVSMWANVAITDEDIFTIAKSNDDNLSSNSLNTLYGSYGGKLTLHVSDLLDSLDIRRNLITKDLRPLKFNGIPSAQAVSNIPVFRKSEMYLIIAEAEAQANNITASQNALFYTAKRNEAIKNPTDLPSSKDELLTFISKENIREFFEEGHRWYNARRTGEKITPNVAGVTGYNVAAFVYPIPADEINAGFCTEQNPNWSDALPKAKK